MFVICYQFTVVLNTLITITPSLIANVIKCKEDGVDIECYRVNLTFYKDIFSIIKNFGNPFETFDLTFEAKLWYQLIITNFLSRDQNSSFLSMNDMHLICFLISRVKVNLPLTIFNYLEEKILISRENEFSFIPFWKVFSELFVQKEIVKDVHMAGLTEALETFWGKKLAGVEGLGLRRRGSEILRKNHMDISSCIFYAFDCFL